MPIIRSPSFNFAGFCVGVKSGENKKRIKLKDGDLIIGIQSSGLHSNGFSLVRKIIKDNKIKLNKKLYKNKTIGNLLIEPTKIYVKPILDLFTKNIIKSCSHITGGGITENLPRSLTKNVQAQIDLGVWNVPEIFKWIHSYGVTQSEMLRTFNCGFGMIVILEKSKLKSFDKTMKKYKLKYCNIGKLIHSNNSIKKIKFQNKLNFDD